MRSSKFLFIICALLLVSSVQTVSADGGYVYTGHWNGSASAGGAFINPSGVAVDSAGNVYVADTGKHRVLTFTSTGTFITQWGSVGTADGQFRSPYGIAVDSAGNVYVADAGNNRVQKFTSTGEVITTWGGAGSGDGQFTDPRDVAVDSAGNVYVADMQNNRVQKFTSTGTFITQWGSVGTADGQFRYPQGIAVDSGGTVYVSDTWNYRVQTFTSTGGFITSWNGSASAGGEFSNPTGIALDSAGNVYVADTGHLKIQKFTSAGGFITSLNSSALAGGASSPPYGVAVDRVGNVYIADKNNNQIQKFSPETPPPAPVQVVTAGFYAFGHVGQAPYSVRFLDRSAGSPTAWTWDFGDGTTSDEQSPTHIYNRTGAYNVALTVSNDLVSNTVIQYRCVIVNTVPVANFTANATAGSTPFTVQFTDESSDATGYQWQFGDGTTSAEKNPIHTYTQPGSYTVTEVVSGVNYGSVSMQKPGYITVSDLSTVGFSANVTTGLAPLAVQFTESVNGSVRYYYWQFGDGSSSFDRNPVHVYDTAGTYTVSLYAIGQNGYQVKTVDDCITITSPVTPTATQTVNPTPTSTQTIPLPVANFTVTPQGGAGSMGILVTDTSVNATSVRYDLGDGTTTAYPTFRYTYWQPGTYTIRQTATSAAGSSVKTVEVTVPAVEPTTTIPPVGGDQGWYTVHCNVDGATVLFDETPMGTIADGILKFRVYTTATPYWTYTVQKDGYSTVSGPITQHPGKDQNVDITVTLTPASGQTPYNGPHTIPGTLQAEDYDLGGEGVAYHDTTAGNEGGVYRQDDVDIETLDTDGSPNIGWIRTDEWLAYTVNVGTAGTYDAGFRVASSHAGSSVQVYLDDGTTPVATVNVPNTGTFGAFQTVSVPVTLPAGIHRLKLTFPTDYVNINWISFALNAGV